MDLSPSQHRIFLLLKKGLTNAEIRLRIGNTHGGLEQIKNKIYKRLNVHSQAELMAIPASMVIEVDGRKRNGKAPSVKA